MRVHEMIRQWHAMFGDAIELTVTTMDERLTRGYFGSARQLRVPLVFPLFLYRKCPEYDGVIACEGSMFKSQFAEALSIFMSGGMGYANAEKKVSVGYGAEAGRMTLQLARFVKRHCRDSLVITRNESSRKLLESLSIRTALGTDTAWTFEAYDREYGSRLLRQRGWNGSSRVLAVCPINPFWWPVKASMCKSIGRGLFGRWEDRHYRSVYFHEVSRDSVAEYSAYVRALASAIGRYARSRNCFVSIIGMERLDKSACSDVSGLLKADHATFTSDEFDMFELISILRRASMLISSRYHAIVATMPALVPSAGIAMDERVVNIMGERGDGELCMSVEDGDLCGRIGRVLERMEDDEDRVVEHIGRATVEQIRRMGNMGLRVRDEICSVYPEFGQAAENTRWEDSLPPLSSRMKCLISTFA
jgi:polysaccharide pyruvyl transferase WcaK-like protein